MQSPIYASPAIRQTEHDCIDVQADANVVVIGEVGPRHTHGMHLTTVQALDALISYLGEARNCLAARGQA
jgi:hypothetical protein